MTIKVLYTNGETKSFPREYEEHLRRIAKELENKTGVMYAKVMDSKLGKAYVDGELVIDREKLLEVAE